MLGQAGLELRGDRAGELADVDLLRAQLQRAGLELRQVQQVDRELAQALDLIPDLVEEPASGLRVEIVVLEQLDETSEREDRRAELV